MKLHRILTLPFAFAADVVTFGNIGGRSYTQQVFDAERYEQGMQAVKVFAEMVVELAKEEKKREEERG